MRVFRTILGMLLLTTGLPAVLAGGGLWAVMQHRDPGGAFSGELQRLSVPGYAVVVPDIDQLLRDDAPFARIGDTQLRLSAVTVDGPAFLGLAPSDQVARYLADVAHSRVGTIDIGTGILPVTTTRAVGRRAPAGAPAQQTFWTAKGSGQLSITPGELGERRYSLVLMNPGGAPVVRLATIAEVRPGWLNPATWGLLTLGTLLLMGGVIMLVWPGRRREVVYVVEPSQVPELMYAIGAPLPLPGGVAYFTGNRGGAHRPRTLADSRPTRPPALPQFAWPPTDGTSALPDGPARPTSAALPGSLATATLTGVPAGPVPHSDPVTGSLPGFAAGGPVPGGTAPADPILGPAASPLGGTGASSPTATASGLPGRPAGARTPAPGQPLSLLDDVPAMSGLQSGAAPTRRGDRNRPTVGDLPEFRATAVGAWVAATAPERARITEARAAARLAEAARRNAGKFAPIQPGARNMPPAAIPIATPRRSGKTSTGPTAETRDTSAATVAETPGATGEVPGADTDSPTPGIEVAGEVTAGQPEPEIHTDGVRPSEPAASPEQPAASIGRSGVPARRPVTSAGQAATPPDALEAATLPDSPEAATPPDSPEAATPPEASGGATPPDASEGDTGEPPATRVALHTGPAATDWTATATTRLNTPRPSRPARTSRARGTAVPVRGGTSTVGRAATPATARHRGDEHPGPSKQPTADTVGSVPAGAPPVWPPVGEAADSPAASVRAPAADPVSADGPRFSVDTPEPAGGVGDRPSEGAGSERAEASRASMHAVEAAVPAVRRSTTTGRPVSDRSADGRPVSDRSADGRPVSDRSADGRPASDRSADGRSTEAEVTGGPAPATVAEPVRANAVTPKNEAEAGAKNEVGGARKPAGPRGREDQLLAKVQNRAAGKPMPARPAPATRRAPAAWIKAAESMAAQVGREAVVPQPDRTGAQPTGEEARAAEARALSYREEAAELLARGAGSAERRRRRTVSGGNRPKTDAAPAGEAQTAPEETIP